MQERAGRKKGEEKLQFLSKFQQIFQNNPIWGKIQYMIQSALTNVSIQLKRLYVVMPKNKQSKFNATNLNKTELQIILMENKLDFPSIIDHGFKSPLSFDYGKIQKKQLLAKTGFQSYHEVMICRAAVGKTYIFPSKNKTQTMPSQEKPQLMTPQFDSVCVYDQASSAKQFKQSYVIYDPQTKCLPQYIAHFQINPERYRQLQQQIICELCEDNTAGKYCQTCDSYFCIKCDTDHHNHKFSYKHLRTELTEKPKVLSECPIHKLLKMELYCKDCNKTLCIDCKVKGDHSSGESLMHNLIRITQKYNETLNNIKDIDTELEKKKKSLRKSIGLVENKLKQINKKNDQLQNSIYQIMQQSLRKLQRITKKKMSLLMSDHIELKRQLDQIQWIQQFMKHQRQVLSPNDFLLSYSRYQNCKKDIIGRNFEVSNILPDMRIQGYINVLTQQQSRTQNALFPKKMDPKNKEFDKFNLFEKTESKNTNVIKSQLNLNQQYDEIKQVVKSKNNLLNLSILKHF